jgi:hypothetical protein
MIEKRKDERFTPKEKILVKEDTGEIINYYHLRDISAGGMYLFKKISSNAEGVSKFTFLIPELMNRTVNGKIYETRIDSQGTYGTAVRFDSETADLKAVVSKVKKI